MLKMESTQLVANSIINSSFEAAVVAATSTFELMGVEYDYNEVYTRVKSKFDYVLDDTGVKNNLIGKAYTVDMALNGKIGSAMRNRNWMESTQTVSRLDADVNKLRMLLSSKGIDQKMRVLNACFKVKRIPAKSSSIISMTNLGREKLLRNELEIDDSLIPSDTQSPSAHMSTQTMEIDNIDYQAEFEKLKTKFEKFKHHVKEKYDGWLEKAKKTNETMKSLQAIVRQQQETIFAMQIESHKREQNVMLKLQDLKRELQQNFDFAEGDGEVLNEVVECVSSCNEIDIDLFLSDVRDTILHTGQGYARTVTMLKVLATQCNLDVSYE
uniref:Non-structural protein 3 n=1 Tax=Rotavirus A TaxID=28875 RepID=A0A1V0FU00_9REOV|nr:NSP3 [Rotavirus A]